MTPQNKLIYDYLKSGRTLTHVVALVSLGVGSLTKRISELRGEGVPIKDRWQEDHFGRRYKEYKLVVDTEG